MTLRVISRSIVLDHDTARILLVRNIDSDFWYSPGGGWIHHDETVQECAVRETYEETGIRIQVDRLLYVQEFHPDKKTAHLELFWMAHPIGLTDIDNHIDLHGAVEEAQWFTKSEMMLLTIYPNRLGSRFWNEISSIFASPNPFIIK